MGSHDLHHVISLGVFACLFCRALEEDESIETHMEEYAAVPRPAGAEDEAKVKKKKKKKEKKKKKKNKGYVKCSLKSTFELFVHQTLKCPLSHVKLSKCKSILGMMQTRTLTQRSFREELQPSRQLRRLHPLDTQSCPQSKRG